MPPFSYSDQDGRTVSLADLAGRPWVADFIYTRCTSACPLLSARMVALARRVADPRVRFISFSVDPEHDTKEALSAYAARWHGDERWRLLRTDRDSVRRLASALLLTVADTGEDQDPILHSNRFLFVDEKGHVRMYDSTDDAALSELATALQDASSHTEPPPRSGAELYASLGCAGCHASPAMAPALKGLRGSTVALVGGGSVVVDDAFIRESIVDPSARVIAGYGPTMPSYAWLPSSELDSLITYVGR